MLLKLHQKLGINVSAAVAMRQETRAERPSRTFHRIGRIAHFWAMAPLLLTIFASACTDIGVERGQQPTLTPTQPENVVTLTPGPAASPSATTVAATSTPELFTPDLADYPEDDSRFLPRTRKSDLAEQRIRELGEGEGLDRVKSLISAEVQRTGRTPADITWEYAIHEEADIPVWIVMVRDTDSGRLFWPVDAEGDGGGLLGVSGGFSGSLDNEGNFPDLEPLENPPLAGTRQEIISDESGWFVVGLRSDATGEVYAWYNAMEKSWEGTRAFAPEGAGRVYYQEDRWVAENRDDNIRWFYDAETARWIEGAFANGMYFERQEEGRLVDAFPGARVYLSPRGDVVVIGAEHEADLAGQVIETKYGTYTHLVTPRYYDADMDSQLTEEAITSSMTFEDVPEWLTDYPGYKQQQLDVLNHLLELQAYRVENPDLVGYPELSANPHNEEMMRIIGTLIDLKNGTVGYYQIDPATYEPRPYDLIVAAGGIGDMFPITNTFPDGIFNPEEDIILRGNGIQGLRSKQLPDGTYTIAYTQPHLDVNMLHAETQFFHYIGRSVVAHATRSLTREVELRYGWVMEHPDVEKQVFSRLVANHPGYTPSQNREDVDVSPEAIMERTNLYRINIKEMVEFDIGVFR